MRSRPIRLDFKGRTHAPSKPTARGGKAAPARPERRTGAFGFVLPRLNKAALKQDEARYRERRGERDEAYRKRAAQLYGC